MFHFEALDERVDAVADLTEPLVELLLDEGLLAA